MGLIKKLIKEVTKPIRNKAKGAVGESKVDSKLNPLIFGRVNHRQINNLILVDENGKSHQIDHVEIRENGVFCIETKNYMGLILGGENQSHWTQCLYGGERHQFLNPLKQNASHIYQLRKVLGAKYPVFSVVVMVKNNADKIDCDNVVNLDDLKSYLKYFDGGVHYTDEQMDYLHNKLMNAAADMSNREHVRNIKETQKELQEGICPRCGAKLVKRKGKYGYFWGCSNYPKCKFILKNKN